MLVDVLGRDQREHIAAARQQLVCDGQAREQMPAGASAGNGDERLG
jgi:hypothetical protein